MNEFFLPNEILNIIFGFINDTQSYLSARLVCKNWYSHLNIVKIFFDKKLKEKVYFLNNYIKFVDLNDKLIADIIFKKYGHYIYKTYEAYNKKIISTPFKLIKNSNSFNTIKNIEYDILKDEKKSYLHQLPGCITM